MVRNPHAYFDENGNYVDKETNHMSNNMACHKNTEAVHWRHNAQLRTVIKYLDGIYPHCVERQEVKRDGKTIIQRIPRYPISAIDIDRRIEEAGGIFKFVEKIAKSIEFLVPECLMV
jgi:hypothetical protein